MGHPVYLGRKCSLGAERSGVEWTPDRLSRGDDFVGTHHFVGGVLQGVAMPDEFAAVADGAIFSEALRQ
jgi:hypothetical protein